MPKGVGFVIWEKLAIYLTSLINNNYNNNNKTSQNNNL